MLQKLLTYQPKSIFVWLAWIVGLAGAYGLAFGWSQPFSDEVPCEYETMYYQSIAINQAHGLGFRVAGPALPIETYHFGDSPDTSRNARGLRNTGIDTFARVVVQPNFYVSAGYPLYLGSVYSVVGDSPRNYKLWQWAVLCIMAASLTWLGAHWLQPYGFVAGLLAGPILLWSQGDSVQWVMTEPAVQMFGWLAALSLTFWDQKRNLRWLFIGGLMLGAATLCKETLVFTLPILGIFWLYHCSTAKIWQPVMFLAIMGLGFATAILPYSFMASSKLGKFIVLNNQATASTTLIDSHNEYSVLGVWMPSWVSNANSFYNKTPNLPESQVGKIIAFYKANPRSALVHACNKLMRGFASFPLIQIWWVGLWVFALMELLRRFVPSLPSFVWLGVWGVVVLAVAVQSNWLVETYLQSIGFKTAMFPYQWSNAIQLLTILSVIPLFLQRKLVFRAAPAILIAMTISVALVTMILFVPFGYQNSRYIRSAEFAFTLLAVWQLIMMALQLVRYHEPKTT